MPGRPSAERGISDATVPSSLKTAPRKVFISEIGRSFGGGGRFAELELAQPPRLELGNSRRWPCFGVLCPDVEYGEYSLVLCTCGEVCAGWCMLSGERYGSRGTMSCAQVAPGVVEMLGLFDEDLDEELQHPPSGGVDEVVAFDLNISTRPSVIPPVGVRVPLDDGEGARSESARSRLGWQHLQGPPDMHLHGLSREATKVSILRHLHAPSTPLSSAPRMASSVLKSDSTSAAAAISCTSFRPFGNVALDPGWPFLVCVSASRGMGEVRAGPAVEVGAGAIGVSPCVAWEGPETFDGPGAGLLGMMTLGVGASPQAHWNEQ